MQEGGGGEENPWRWRERYGNAQQLERNLHFWKGKEMGCVCEVHDVGNYHNSDSLVNTIVTIAQAYSPRVRHVPG